MNRSLIALLMTTSALSACLSDSSDKEDGNPKEKVGVVNLETSRLGMSGGFVDVNADGKMDFVVGAPEAKISSAKAGAALVHLDYEANKTASIDALLSGEEPGDYFGFSFANVGDVNDDGKIDFAVGAINAAGDAELSGAVYVYEGGSNPPKLLAKLNGEQGFDKFGYSISSGDLNGDGNSDVIVTAPHTYHEEFMGGGVYVYFGGNDFDNAADVVIRGEKVRGSMGMAAAAGDINGDGVDDLFVDASAKVYVYYGGDDFKARVDADPTPGLKIRSDGGAHGGSGFGYALAYAGDINGDGFGDIAIGNKRRSSPTFYDNAGTLYLFKGGADLPAEYFEDDANYRIVKVVGAGFDEQLASSIINVGDVNDGGKPDLVVGARWANSGENADKLITGNVYLFHGEDLNVDDPTVDQTVELAHKSFSNELGSAEQGTFVAVHEHALVSGMPGSNKHNGGLHITALHEGVEAVAGAVAGGEADPHAGH